MRAVDLRIEKKFEGKCKRTARKILVNQVSRKKVPGEAWGRTAYRLNKIQGTRIPMSLRKECCALDPCYIHQKAKSKRKIQRALYAQRKAGTNG